jgi:hypothetical protein
MDNVKHQQKISSVSGGHIIKLKFSPAKDGPFPLSKHLASSIPVSARYHRNKTNFLIPAGALNRVTPSKQSVPKISVPSATPQAGSLFHEGPTPRMLPCTIMGNWKLQCHEWSRRGRTSHLHIQDPMSTCAPGAQAHDGQNCQKARRQPLSHSCFW